MYDGPNSKVSNNSPGVIKLILTCPKGVSGVLSMTVWDCDIQQREEKIYVNGVLVEGGIFNNADLDLKNDFDTPQTVQYSLNQADTQTGQVVIEVKQTANSNVPTFGGPNPNAVLSSVHFSILEGFKEHDSVFPYVIDSKITGTYDSARLIPGWEITVTVSRSDSYQKYVPVSLTTTISK